MPPNGVAGSQWVLGVVIDRLEELLSKAAIERGTLTYAQVARALELEPPHTIHQTTELLAALMRKHASERVPQLASLVISRTRGGLPAPGFFMLLNELGLYGGSSDGDDAMAFHDVEKKRCYAAASSKGSEDVEARLR